MRAIKMLSGLVFVAALAVCLSSMLAAQPEHCAQNLFCLFNQEAAVSDHAGIHKYSEDLIGLIVPNPGGDNSLHKLTSQLADRLAKAEQGTRDGTGKLVTEAVVAKAFNELAQEIEAPPSAKIDEAAIHQFRAHAASIKAFPALFSADRNGTNCNPGEAVFLLSLLISDNGVLLKGNLDSAVALMKWNGQQGGGGVGVSRIAPMYSSTQDLLARYSSHHNFGTNKALFDHAMNTLSF
ncbi:hypothetical protein [Terracidiphilus sp.]|jgi:hypothetical protein|uniref:hypothetical protein n=1 Tax=Terracidiphilus sp. TaxID=1964191 RepID=UPI003C17747E